MTNDAMRAETVWLEGAVDVSDSRGIETYLAQPLDRESFGSIVVIHHMPGFDEPSREITRNFAAGGIAAICPNLYSREGQGKSAKEIFQLAMAQSGVPDDRLLADVSLAADRLRSLPGSNGKVGVIGYCSGGRQSYLVACSLPVDAAVDCYGGRADVNLAPQLRCPLLGLFGVDDQSPSPDDVAMLEKALDANGKTFDFTPYDGAGHAFFSVDRPSYRVDAAKDGWKRIWAFYDTHLKGT